MERFAKVVRVVLFLHVALASFVAVAYWVGLTGFSDGDIESRKAAAFLAAFAVLLALAALRLPGDPRWIQPVVAVVGFNLVDTVYELFALGNGAFVPPLVIETLALGVYGTFAWRTMRHAHRRSSRATTPAPARAG